LLAAGCAPDHVHVLLRLSPSAALRDVVQRLKGGSSYDVNQRLRPNATLTWQSGYWAESLGPADTSSLVRYLRTQRFRHDDSHPAERVT
jgi:REP element-mobilizing transposase RayT